MCPLLLMLSETRQKTLNLSNLDLYCVASSNELLIGLVAGLGLVEGTASVFQLSGGDSQRAASVGFHHTHACALVLRDAGERLVGRCVDSTRSRRAFEILLESPGVADDPEDVRLSDEESRQRRLAGQA